MCTYFIIKSTPTNIFCFFPLRAKIRHSTANTHARGRYVRQTNSFSIKGIIGYKSGLELAKTIRHMPSSFLVSVEPSVNHYI